MNDVQKKELNVLKEVIKIIEDNNLRYFAIGGTCIGAIRHHGFIPWDDDIDIAMPRADYEILRTKLYKELPKKFKKLDGDNSKRNNFLFTKIYDSSTTLVEKYAYNSPDRYTGAFVDIMPIDGFPNNKSMQKYIQKKCAIYNYMNYLCRPFPYNYAWSKRVIKAMIRSILHIIFKYNFFSSKIAKLLDKFDYDSSEYVYFTWRSNFNKGNYMRVFPHYYFDSYVSMPFEDINIRVPKEYHKYLQDDYGDYMQLPPLEEQKSVHNVIICDMNNPCEYYAKIKEEEFK